MKDVQKLRKGFSLFWSSRNLSLSLNLMIVAFITFYATDTLGLAPALVGTLLLLSKVFDGFTDLAVGYIIDRTHTRWGKARPYELFLLPLWICTFLLFLVPDMGTTGKAVWLFIMYTLINSVCVTCLYGSDAVYLKRAVIDGSKRNSVLSVSGFIVSIANSIGYTIMPMLIANLGGTQKGWLGIALMIGIPSLIIGLLRFFFVEEVEEAEEESDERKKEASVNLIESIKILFSNKYVVMVALAGFLTTVINTLSQSVGTYYFTYNVGNLSLMSLVTMVGIGTPFILLFFPAIMRKLGSMTLTRIGLILGVAGGVIRYFAGSNLLLLIVTNLLCSVAVLPLACMENVYLIDCMEYSFLKTGKKVEGIMASLNNFLKKLGGAAASGGLGIIMGMAGYDGLAAVQTESAVTTIKMLYSLVPGAIFLIAFIILCFYDLEKKLVELRAGEEKKV